MVDKTTLAFIALTLILALSFRDMVTADPEAKLKDDMAKNLEKDTKFNHENNDNDLDFDEPEDKLHDFDDDIHNEKGYENSENDNFNDFDTPPEQINMKKIPSLKMKGNVQTIKFRFCYSCGYRNMFDQYTAIIAERYPDLKIVGENFAPTWWKLYVVQFLTTFKILVIACILFGQDPFVYLNMNTPNVFTWATDNKLYASLMIFFISNAIETQLITTGAFEIYLNDMQIWSKLQSDRMPHEKELLQMLDMNFNFEQEKNTFQNDGNFRI
jgi:selT/selW/selH-like putative selenoprotein